MTDQERDPMSIYDEVLPPPEETKWGLDEEDRYREVGRRLWWRPRDRSKQLHRAEARLEGAKNLLKESEASHAEAKFKAHRYRWVPFVAGHWKEELRRRSEALEAAKAQVKWRELQLEKARARKHRREVWDALHAPEIAERQELSASRDQEVLRLGRKKLEELRRRPGSARGVDVSLVSTPHADEAWARRLGEQELRRQIEAQRAERRRQEQRNQDRDIAS